MIIGLKQTTPHRPPVIGQLRSGMCGKNGLAYVFWSEALHELNSQMWGSRLVCLECLLQSEFLSVCDILVGNDVVMGVRELLRGRKQRLRGKFVEFGGRNCKLGCLKTSHSNPVSLSFPIHKMGTIRPPQYLQVMKEHYFKNFAMSDYARKCHSQCLLVHSLQ